MTADRAFLRCEIYPSNLNAAIDFYTQVLAFHVIRDERETSSP